jgi:polysaccharide deacetylase family protein (PEP-CTERM system associated)
MRHALSFDVECFYQYNLRDFLGRVAPPTSEVERNVTWLLDVLAARGIRATFYVLGNVAVAFPDLVRRMEREGHEIGVHGHDHVYLDQLDARGFRDELRRARAALEAAGATGVIGHRAPRFSLSSRTEYAWDVLVDEGFRYDSSIVPARGAHGYGDANATRSVHRHRSGLYEVPLTSVDVGPRRVPAIGGGYVRYFPFAFTRWALARREAEELPAVAYFHPYEFDSRPAVPSVDVTQPLASLRYLRFCAMQSYGRGEAMQNKLLALLASADFGPVKDLLPAGAA